MTALLDAMAGAGDRLVAASGGRIAFDPRRALSRADDLDLGEPGPWSPNRHCRLVACRDGWIAVSLAREEDRELIPAWTGAGFDEDPWDAVIASAATRDAAEMAAAAVELHMPAAVVGEARAPGAPSLQPGGRGGGEVIDLSALWAGPYCGALLAEAGHDVIKVESPDRPDPTPLHTPRLDARLNGGKRRRQMAFGGDELLDMIAAARVLITSARPHALARLGLNEARLFAINPRLLWIAITAHGWHGENAMRVGFGDDCAAAGGLLIWEGSEPRFIGDALADPLTGVTAATLALEALEAGECGLLDVALAPTAATFADALR
ncbi:MAG TPA: CoA transferase [Sphingopyxis sp.]|nr:CoA transferase [Sphingopyxis sp.]HMP45515.1 CoA transferase [Sphingopyxis sp.]HMQ18562.1 CoA transferase [Sphingopyxis sp.]